MKNKPYLVKFINTLPKMVGIFPEPEPASKNIPNWYKNVESFLNNDQTPVNGHQNITVKRCLAFLDILTSGYIIKTPFDIYIDTTDGKSIFDIPEALKPLAELGNKQLIGNHPLEQVPGFPFDKDQYIEYLFRIYPIWVVKTDPGISCLFIQPQHHENSPLFAISAVIDSDGYPSEGLFSFLVKKDFKGFVKKGTPLVQVIPFARKDYVHEIIYSQEDASQVKMLGLKIRSVFNSGYKKYFWKKKNYL
jgi:hypothetical protein